MRSISVVLPQPEGPMRTVNLPRSTVKEQSLMAVTARPSSALYTFVTLRTSISPAVVWQAAATWFMVRLLSPVDEGVIGGDERRQRQHQKRKIGKHPIEPSHQRALITGREASKRHLPRKELRQYRLSRPASASKGARER